MLPFADRLARRHRFSGEPADDLSQVARLGLVTAVDRYDPGRGSFTAFAVTTITGELKRHFRDHTCGPCAPPDAESDARRRAGRVRSGGGAGPWASPRDVDTGFCRDLMQRSRCEGLFVVGVPAVRTSSPDRIVSSVDLPDPETPTRAISSPRSTTKLSGPASRG
jgi:RNA polymerase sigma factor (sigma-70 family)